MPTQWKDYPNTTTPITAAALNDIETRLSNVTTQAASNRSLITNLRRDLDLLKNDRGTDGSASFIGSWSRSTMRLVRIGKIVVFTAKIHHSSAVINAGQHSSIGIIPTGFRPHPSQDEVFIAGTSWVSGSGSAYAPGAVLRIQSSTGNIDAIAERRSTNIYFSGSWTIA